MLVRAKTNFSGVVSMSEGDVRDIKDSYILQDLMNAGYVEIEAQEAEIVEKPVKKAYTPEEKVGKYTKATIGMNESVEISKKTSTKKKKSKK